MKRIFITYILTHIILSSYAQYEITKDSIQNQYLISKLDSMGIENNYILNKYEIEYFNAKFEKKRGDFDFSNKKVAFFTGSNGSTLHNSKDYFSTEKDRFSKCYTSNNSYLKILTEKEKIDSGGFDAIIIYWAKMHRSMKYYIRELQTKGK